MRTIRIPDRLAQPAIDLLDAGVKQLGLGAAKAAGELLELLQQAKHENEAVNPKKEPKPKNESPAD